MRIVVVDDQFHTERATAFSVLQGVGLETSVHTSMPTWEAFKDADLISWDSDLGNGEDVVDCLARLFWDDQERFRTLFQTPVHVVHSANSVAAMRIAGYFQDIGAQVSLIPITAYANGIQKFLKG
jgi:hypothetical protein